MSLLPLLQAKVMGQLGQTWHFSTLYRGLLEQTLRTTVMLAFIFVPYDYARRESQLFKSLYGQAAIVTAVCGGAYAVGWPFETMKNLRQAGLPSPKATFSQRIAYVGGPLGLFRGAVPGIACGGEQAPASPAFCSHTRTLLLIYLGLPHAGGARTGDGHTDVRAWSRLEWVGRAAKWLCNACDEWRGQSSCHKIRPERLK